jgi:hypothetical protein
MVDSSLPFALFWVMGNANNKMLSSVTATLIDQSELSGLQAKIISQIHQVKVSPGIDFISSIGDCFTSDIP